jgi:filamentous hemagglutinin family protein
VLSEEVTYGQAPSPITSSGLNTQVSAPVTLPGGAIQRNITGGTRPGSGGNLFHSFGEFGVPTDNIANFLNDTALPTTNILSRVSGGNPSNILGTIQTEGFGNANLFLMNPAGIVFGPDASLNVGGAAHFTTADYLRVADGVQFTALPGAQDKLLSIAPVVAFGFLESNPVGITVEGSTLSVGEGQTLALVGGDLAISGSLKAANGAIGLVSVSSPGEALANRFDPGSDFTQLGNIRISQGGEINVSGIGENGGGTVVIRGGRLTISPDGKILGTTSGERNAGIVDIDLKGDLILAGTGTQEDTQSGIFVTTEGNGKGGTVRLNAKHVDIRNGGQISATTFGPGDAGTITITATDGAVSLLGSDHRSDVSGRTQEEAFVSGLYAATVGTGRAGRVTLQTKDLTVTEGARIDVSTFGRGNGDAGDIHVTSTGDIGLSGTHRNGIWQSGLFGEVQELSPLGEGLLGSAGNITLTGQTIEVNDGAKISLKSLGASQAEVDQSRIPSPGTVNIQAGTLRISGANTTSQAFAIDPSEISTGVTGPTAAGNININVDNMSLHNGGLITAETSSATNVDKGGTITINAREDIAISGVAVRTEFPPNIRPQDGVNNRSILSSAIRARTSGINPGSDIVMKAKNLTITEGGQIINGSLGEGPGGVQTIDVADTVRLSGSVEFLNPRLLNRSTISNATSGRGNAGELRITARNVELLDGAEISSKTLGKGSGNAGNVTINATENVTLSGISKLIDPPAENTSKTLEISSQISSSAVELGGRNEELPLGSGGDITVTAKTITLQDGASIQTKSLGANATEIVKGKVANTPEEDRPYAGDITILADNLTVSGARTTGGNAGFSIFPSEIASGATGPAGTGNIIVEAREITVRDSAVITSETESRTPGVQRGIVNLTAHETLRISGNTIRTGFPEHPQQDDPRPEDSAHGRTIRISGIFARTSGTNPAGDITISAHDLFVTDGAQVATDALGFNFDNAGSAGKIMITAENRFTLSGAAPVGDKFGNQLSSIVSSRTQGPGNSGEITVAAKILEIADGAQISATTNPGPNSIGAGDGGHISVSTTGTLAIHGIGSVPETSDVPSGIHSRTAGSGQGGVITITSPEVQIQNGGTMSTQSSGSGNAGKYTIDRCRENFFGWRSYYH